MSIRWIKRNEIDAEKWENCVSSCPQTDTIFAQLWYLDACCDQWCALVEDEYKAVLPLCHRKKFGISYIFPPFFVAQIGILGNSQSEITEWIAAIPKKFLKIEIIFNAFDTLPENIQQKAFRHRTFLLHCSSTYEKIRSQYHQNHRRNLKKAEHFGLKITRKADAEEVICLFRQTRGRKKNVGFSNDDYLRLKKLITLLNTHQTLETWGVTNAEGKLEAAAFFTRWKHRYTFLFSGRTKSSNDSRAMFFLLDKFIQNHAEENILLDFNGSNDEAIAKFYNGFGAEESHFFQINTSPLQIKR